MDLESIKFFTQQYQEMRAEIKSEIRALREDLDQRLGDQSRDLKEHRSETDTRFNEVDTRLAGLEQFNWKLTAICVAAVFLLEVGFRVIEIALK